MQAKCAFQRLSILLFTATLWLLSPGGHCSPSPQPISPESHLNANRETAFPGENDLLEAVTRYHSVTADGSLNITIPLYTVPGRIPVDLDLTYRSGIKVDQYATWVGLGWNLGNWSVRRIAVHGDDTWSPNPSVGNSRNDVNDIYEVSIPGRSLKFMNTGTVANPSFVPLSFTHDSLWGALHFVNLGHRPYYEYDYFILTDDRGARYVFKQALKKMDIYSPYFFHVLWPGQQAWTVAQFTNAEWLLTAILSHDYVDGGGDPLDPLDSERPREDNGGYWVAFVHRGKCYRDQWGVQQRKDEFSSDTVYMGPVAHGSPLSSTYYQDTTEITYLYKIITPSTLVRTTLTQLHRYRTPRYLSSASDDDNRQKDAMLAAFSVYKYSGDSTLPTGPELYRVSFNYELDSSPAEKPLKWSYFARYGWGASDVGEPALREIVIATENPYSRQFGGSDENELCYGGAQLPGEYSRRGLKRKFTFSYIDSTELYSDLAVSSGAYHMNRAYWACGGPFQDFISPDFDNPEWVELNRFLARDWAGRDYFGYFYYHPEIWSLRSVTVPEGLEYEYSYEASQYRIANYAWQGGGCRVSRIVINPAHPAFPFDTRDYSEIDTICFTYGHNDDGFGFATSLPANYWRAKTMHEVVLHPPMCADLPANLEFFQTDNAAHTIQYPRIKWGLPDGRGSIEHYYLTADSVGGNRKRTMYYWDPTWVCGWNPFLPEESLGVYTSAEVEARYSFWQDRSPLVGARYRKVLRDNDGRELLSEQNYYSFVPIAADTAVDDSIISISPATGSGQFTTGDTVQAGYFLQLDSVIRRRDGVESRSTYIYDGLHRLQSNDEIANDHRHVTRYDYASDYWPSMRDRHYLSTLKSRREHRQNLDGSDERIMEYTEHRYRSDFPSQNESGQNTIWYLSKTREWVDIDEDGTLDTAAGSEFLVDEILDVGHFGEATLVSDRRGIRTGLVHSYQGLEAHFTNIENGSFAIFTGESDFTNQPMSVHLGSNGEIDSTTAFTGSRCARIVWDGNGTDYGVTAQSGRTLDGTYVAEIWGRCTQPNAFRLTVASFSNGVTSNIVSKYVTAADEWQRVVCSLLVSPPDTLTAYTALASSGTAHIDDLRVYPISALAESQTLDAMRRPTSESDHNNIPTRYYYSQYNEAWVTADHDRSPSQGQERFYSSTERGGGTYARSQPNALLTFRSRGSGLIEDFSTNPLSEYSVTGNGSLVWKADKKRLLFEQDFAGSSYNDILIPVESFSDGFVALDVLAKSHEYDPGKSSERIDLNFTNLWFGFENGSGQGYAVVFGFDDAVTVFKYSQSGYGNKQVIAQRQSSTYQPFRQSEKTRFMFGKAADQLYVFRNNDCILHCSATDLNRFSYLKIRVKDFGDPSWEYQSIWLDNLVFYSDPVITADFINSFGRVSQRQVLDGSRVIVSGSRNTLDGLDEIVFMPIAVNINIDYWDWPSYGLNHRSPFDLIWGYHETQWDLANMYHWQPGEDLDSASYLHSYYGDSVGTPDCSDPGNIQTPYSEIVYSGDPLRRIDEVRYPGLFRGHPTRYQYGHNEAAIGGFDPVTYGLNTLFKEKVVNENGRVDVTYRDKRNQIVGIVRDSTDPGINAYTRFHLDFNGNDTLIVQPQGQAIRKKFNNVGWLLQDRSGDYGLARYFYDQTGKLRFAQSATDASEARFRYVMYDALGRKIEEGFYFDTKAMDWEHAFDRGFPSAGATITREYEYDQGEFGRGRLTRATVYPSGMPDSASWEAFTYDEYGRLVEKEQYVFGIDSVSARVTRAEYNRSDQITRLIYPNGYGAVYAYDRAGRPAAFLMVSGQTMVLDYWPNDLVKWKTAAAFFAILKQRADYKYNARNWLLSVNDGVVSSETDSTGDHFALLLTYDTGAYRGVCQPGGGSCDYPVGYHNGNVASYTLRTSPGSGSAYFFEQFAYDPLDRLVGIDYSNPPDIHSIQYDQNGNMTHFCCQAGGCGYDYQYYPGTNRLEQVTNLAPGISNFLYTPSGSMTLRTDIGHQIGYNLHEQTARRVRPGVAGDNTAEYWYNHDGQRIAKRYTYSYLQPCDSLADAIPMGAVGPKSEVHEPSSRVEPLRGSGPGGSCLRWGMTRRGYYYFGDNLVAEYTGPAESDLVANYVYVNGERLASFKEDNPADGRFYFADHLGSVIATIDHLGTLRNRYQYRPWGKRHGAVLVDHNDFQFTAKPRDDELGLEWYYFGSRYYDPELRLFTQVDPKRGKYPSWGPYVYTQNNPLSKIDRDGEWVESAVDIFSVLLSGKDFYDDPSVENAAWLVVDVLALAIPFVPAVGSIRHAGKIDDILEAMKRGKETEKKVLKAEGLTKNRKMIEVTDPETGKTGKTMPDAIRPDGTTVDVKDQKYLTDSDQLRKQSQVTKEKTGGKAEIIQARRGGRVSKPVEKRMNVRRWEDPDANVD